MSPDLAFGSAPPPHPTAKVTAQPQPHAGMTVKGNRNAKAQPVAADGTRDWTLGLCGAMKAHGSLCVLSPVSIRAAAD